MTDQEEYLAKLNTGILPKRLEIIHVVILEASSPVKYILLGIFLAIVLVAL